MPAFRFLFFYLLLFNGLHLFFSHFPGIPLRADLFYPRNARGSIGTEYKAEYLCHERIELLARCGPALLRTLCAGSVVVFTIALSHTTPGRLLILRAPRTPSLQIRSACAAIQAAVGDQ
jgi:hypothetical protein